MTDVLRMPADVAPTHESHLVIDAKDSAHMPSPRELWLYRDLLSMLVWRDISTRYRQTLLGPIWFIVQPLLPALVFTVLLGRIAGLSTDGRPSFLFYLCNQVAWGMFANVFGQVSGSLLGNVNIFSKVYFPRLIVPLAQVVSSSVTFAVQLGFLAVMVMITAIRQPDAGLTSDLGRLVFLIPAILFLAVLGLGFGLWMSALTAKYRDLSQITPVLVQVWMYGSSVLIPLSQLKGVTRSLVSANPVSVGVEAVRYSVLGSGTVTAMTLATGIATAVVVLISGIWIFNRSASTFVDTA